LFVLAIPAAQLVARGVGHAAPYDTAPFSWAIALVPAAIGALLGLALRGAMPAAVRANPR